MAETDYTKASIAKRFSDFILSDVKLSSRVLGTGSFGEVVQATWGGTVCAVKRLHRVYSVLPEDATSSIVKRYLQECQTWSQLRHPGIVLFLGVVFEPGDSYLPLLVMEKMDISLLQFVESSTKASLQLRHKANILLQVACAMAYLHGKKLVHRDLTPNNILIDKLSIKAKVTDFGLTRVAAESRVATKSAAGTPTFMPPEALCLEPRHDSKLDVFSFGNLILFTTTHKWPQPDVQVSVVNGTLKPFTEYERRETYVAILDSFEKQLFLRLIQESLDNDPDRRPTSPDVMKRMEEIVFKIPKDMGESALAKGSAKDSMEATDSARATELSRQLEDRNSKLFDYALEIGKLKEEKKKLAEKAESLERQLRQSESTSWGLKPANLSSLAKYSPLQPQEPFHNDQLALSKELIAVSMGPMSCPSSPDLSQSRSRARINLRLKRSAQPFLPKMGWSEEGNGLPHAMFMASAAAIGGTVYVGGGYSSAAQPTTDLYKFSLEEKQWVILPPPPHPVSGFALVAQGDKLHLIGGEYARARSPRVSNKVQTLNVSSDVTEWSITVPPLKTPRYSAAAISHDGYIIVAGGLGIEEEPVHTLEVIYLDGGKKKAEWFSINKMPLRCHVRPQLVMCNKVVYLAGRQEDAKDNAKVFSIPFRELLDASKSQSHHRKKFTSQREQENITWSQESAVVAGAALFVLGGHMMAAGGAGEEGGHCWSYNTELKAWLKCCSIPRVREDPATVCSEDKVILLGGSSQSPAGERKAVSYVDIGTQLE